MDFIDKWLNDKQTSKNKRIVSIKNETIEEFDYVINIFSGVANVRKTTIDNVISLSYNNIIPDIMCINFPDKQKKLLLQCKKECEKSKYNIQIIINKKNDVACVYINNMKRIIFLTNEYDKIIDTTPAYKCILDVLYGFLITPCEIDNDIIIDIMNNKIIKSTFIDKSITNCMKRCITEFYESTSFDVKNKKEKTIIKFIEMTKNFIIGVNYIGLSVYDIIKPTSNFIMMCGTDDSINNFIKFTKKNNENIIESIDITQTYNIVPLIAGLTRTHIEIKLYNKKQSIIIIAYNFLEYFRSIYYQDLKHNIIHPIVCIFFSTVEYMYAYSRNEQKNKFIWLTLLLNYKILFNIWETELKDCVNICGNNSEWVEDLFI